MKLTEKNLRRLARTVLKELFTKSSGLSPTDIIKGKRGDGGYDSATFGYDDIGFDDGFADDGGFGEADESDLEEITEDEEDLA